MEEVLDGVGPPVLSGQYGRLVGVQVDALGELVDERIGFPIRARTPDQIAAGIRTWLADRAAARERGKLGQRLILEERTFAKEAAATVSFYEELHT